MKKIYPWIPLIGTFLAAMSPPQKTGLDKPVIFMVSALWQGLWWVAILYKAFK